MNTLLVSLAAFWLIALAAAMERPAGRFAAALASESRAEVDDTRAAQERGATLAGDWM